MSKSVAAIRFELEEKEWISAFAGLNGQSFSAQVRQWTLERLEDEMDSRDLLVAINESDNDSTDVGIGIVEFMKKYKLT